MAVGKGSMDRASKAVKSKETKNTAISPEEIQTETVKNGESKATKKAAEAVKKPAAKRKSEGKTGGKKEMKAAVITAVESQVMEQVKKEQEIKKEKEISLQDGICRIGDEMPVYFL